MSFQLPSRVRWTLFAPGLMGVTLLVFFPVAVLFGLSLCNWHAYEANGHFVGLDNFAQLAHSEEFWWSVWWTIEYTLLTVGLQTAIGLIGALALLQVRRIAAPLMAVLLLPYVLPTVLVAFVWRWMLDPSIGVVNKWGSSLGVIPRDFAWVSRDHLRLTLVVVGTWQFFPFALLLIYARLLSIPRVKYEAAAIDGYSPFQTFFRVTIPQIAPVLGVVALLRALFMATKFDTVWLMGGQEAVGKWVQTMPVLSYQTTFERQDAGMGAAVSVTLLLLLLVAVVIVTGVLHARRATK